MAITSLIYKQTHKEHDLNWQMQGKQMRLIKQIVMWIEQQIQLIIKWNELQQDLRLRISWAQERTEEKWRITPQGRSAVFSAVLRTKARNGKEEGAGSAVLRYDVIKMNPRNPDWKICYALRLCGVREWGKGREGGFNWRGEKRKEEKVYFYK